MGIDKVLKQALGRPPRPGLVPQSGDPMHPDRWVRPEGGSPATRGARAAGYKGATPGEQGESATRHEGGASPEKYERKYPTKQNKQELAELFHLARVAGKESRYDRMVWAANEFVKTHPEWSKSSAYKAVEEAIEHPIVSTPSLQKNSVRNKSVSKQVKNPWAVAAAAAKRMGYKDFSEGTAGREKRDEIAEALKKPRKMDKQVSASVGFPAGKGYMSSDVTTKQKAPSVEKHYTGAKHEHLESGQWVRPGMKTVPGKTWGGKVLAKEEDTVEKGLVGKTIIGPLKWPKPKIKVKRGQGLSFLGKGGVGSGRKPSAKGTLARMSAVKPAIRQYQQLRTPAAHQQVVEAFRQHEQKKEPLEELTHPWDKMYKAVVEKLGVSSGS